MDGNEEVVFKSSNVLLEMARDEYTKEKDRSTSLDNKASFFITVIAAVATIFVPIIPFANLTGFFKDFKEHTWFALVCAVFFLIMLLASFVVLVAAFKNLYDAYKLTEYKSPNLKCIEDKKFHLASPDAVNKGLCDHYKTIVENNREVNTKKCGSIKLGLKLCGIGFLLLIASTVGLLIIVGG